MTAVPIFAAGALGFTAGLFIAAVCAAGNRVDRDDALEALRRSETRAEQWQQRAVFAENQLANAQRAMHPSAHRPTFPPTVFGQGRAAHPLEQIRQLPETPEPHQ